MRFWSGSGRLDLGAAMSDSLYARLTEHTDSDDGNSFGINGQLQQSLLHPHLDTVVSESDMEHSQMHSSVQDIPFHHPSLLTRALAPPRTSQRTVKKGRRTKWRVIYESGDSRTIEADKRSLIQMMGLEIPMRDMRLLDASIPSAETVAQILIRENALVFGMEHVRLIITAEKVLVPADGEKPERLQHMPRIMALLERAVKDRHNEHAMQGENDKPYNDSTQLPFELHMLEVALGEVCRQLANEAQAVDAVAHPALDALTRNPDTGNLARVRTVKGQHQRLLGRVKIIREGLERYLEDDSDMLRMCLTKRKEMEAEGQGVDPILLQRVASASRRNITPHSVPMSPMSISTFNQFNQINPLQAGAFAGSLGNGIGPMGSGQLGTAGSGMLAPGGASGQGGAETVVSSSETMDCHDLLEVENLLESYFSMIDSTYNKLLVLGEYIDDTEDYINIELDYNRNRLIRFEILLTTATFALAFFAVVTGILGENVPLPAVVTKDLSSFYEVNGLTLTFCLTVFALISYILRLRKLI